MINLSKIHTSPWFGCPMLLLPTCIYLFTVDAVGLWLLILPFFAVNTGLIYVCEYHWPKEAGIPRTSFRNLYQGFKTSLYAVFIPSYTACILANLLGLWLASFTSYSIVWEAIPMALQGVIALIIMDFLSYWKHRYFHASKWLFTKIHRVHHAAPQFSMINASCVSAFDLIFNVAPGCFILGLTGMGTDIVLIAITCFLALSTSTHMNVNFNYGIFEYLIVTPRFHRWHHALRKEPKNSKNFGDVFPWWDILFGTYARGEYGGQVGLRHKKGDQSNGKSLK
jgi:sterol desaturase/sphingolipid hydroxylase (fatty acid hydroxylase superfamily)